MKGSVVATARKKDASSMLIKVILFALWVAIVDFWLIRHVGSTNMGELLGLPLGTAVIIAVIDFFIDSEEQEKVKQGVRRIFKRHLNWRVISVLYILSFAFAMAFTSLHIAPLGNNKSNQISLTALGSNNPVKTEQSKPGESVSFLLFINPFATHYKLSIAGYLDKIVNLQPFVGTTIVPNQDLIELPTILFRPSGQSNALLANNGWFELYRKHSDGTFHLITEQQGKLAWFSGPRRQQPNSLHNEWRLELSANDFKAKPAAILMLRWRNPKLLVLKNDIGPEQLVCALITNIDRNKYFAGMVAKVTSSPYQDLPLADFVLKDLSNEMGNNNHSADTVCNWLTKGTS